MSHLSCVHRLYRYKQKNRLCVHVEDDNLDVDRGSTGVPPPVAIRYGGTYITSDNFSTQKISFKNGITILLVNEAASSKRQKGLYAAETYDVAVEKQYVVVEV